MKNLISAICAVSILIGAWLIFANYSERQIDSFRASIETAIIPAAEAEDWKSSSESISELDRAWHIYKKKAIFFLDTDAINEIDYSLAKAVKYVKAEDVSNSSGELNAMLEQLSFLCQNDELNWGNIF